MASLIIRRVDSVGLSGHERAAVTALCTQAYDEPFAPYLTDIGPGTHLLGYVHDELVAHAMWVTREFRVEGVGTLRSAYIEAVATLPSAHRRGYASALLRACAPLLAEHDIALLSPSDAAFYERLGWTVWRGPLSYKAPDGSMVPTPDEEIMYLPLPRTPSPLDTLAAAEVDWRPGEVW